MRRRITAATVFLLMLHLTALGSGLAWAVMPGTACDSASDSAMAGMTMPATPQPSNDAPGSSAPEGCNLPWALGCTSAAPCGPSATMTASFTGNRDDPPAAGIVASVQRMPRSLAIAPELPPPRA